MHISFQTLPPALSILNLPKILTPYKTVPLKTFGNTSAHLE